MSKPKCEWRTCRASDKECDHMMFDNCLACAPWWWNVAVCPRHERKLTSHGWCRECKRFYDATTPPANDMRTV